MDDLFVDAISRALHAAFGDGYRIYADENVTQGLIEPCFLIALITSSSEHILDKRHERPYRFMVHYLPEREGDFREMRRIVDPAYAALYHLILEDGTESGTLVRATQLEHDMADGVLHITVAWGVAGV